MCDLHDHSHIITARGAMRRVDACIRALVQHLNDNGLVTFDSCCGHGKRYGHITIGEMDAERARALGFRVCTSNGAGNAAYPFAAVDGQVNIILAPVITEERSPSSHEAA